MTGCRDSCQKESITAPAIEPLSNDDYTENIELRGAYDFGILRTSSFFGRSITIGMQMIFKTPFMSVRGILPLCSISL